MIYPTLPPAPRDPLKTAFTSLLGAVLAAFLVGVAALVVGVAISAHNSLDTPPVSAFTTRR